ncbi:MAG: peptide chain release factor N(5)-glutamine methyltransferase [Tannerella sp.]|jgi:release factor glutamine methyltransferase|nr:peptide chain release factor N(5)-glutamine methyltransferase [Tannerella sp.]
MNKTSEYIKDTLKDLYTRGEINSMIRLIFNKICGMSINCQILDYDRQISDNQIEKITKITERLKKMEPLQYILGETEFYSIPISLNPYVLIPRPETEELVDMIVKSDYIRNHNKKTPFRIIDIGTGSGCISIALAKNIPNSEIIATDISFQALQNTINNLVSNNISNIVPLNINIFDEDGWKDVTGKFEIIVSNPPYVLNSEKKNMSDNVLKYEPHRALFVPNGNPLKFYKAIAGFAWKKLLKNGRLFLEINPLFDMQLKNLLIEKGFKDVKIKKDLSGKNRFITAKK